ncbi:insulin-like growth factor binding protein [Anaeramoeba flamelloides]|uniref:Insulin-like growth factor binding protein n=1 Tax=Anaeramoeba flamelloides TaxID=1746091 RepID=A0ABQ8Z7C8_9EUKA|nr:insulin-like growth factor binding protein [Anaeramoeba flamelloides]
MFKKQFVLLILIVVLFQIHSILTTSDVCTKKLPPSIFGNEFQVNTYTNSNQTNPSIASIGSNNEMFVVTWQSYGQDGSGYGIFAQRYNSNNGSKLGVEFPVNSNLNYNQENPSIASIGSNNEMFVVTWQSYGQDGSDYGIYAQIFDSNDGSKLGEEFSVNSHIYYDQKNPSIASIGSNKEMFVVTWQSFNQDDSESGIYAQRYDSNDWYPIGAEFQVNTYTNSEQTNPSIASIGSNNEKFVVTWQSHGQDASGYGIFAQIFDSNNGSKIGAEFQVNTYTDNNQENPSIASIASNNGEMFVITWQSFGQDGSGYGIYAQMFDSNNGTKIGNELQVYTHTDNNQVNPTVLDLKNDLFIIVWESNNQEIYLQIFDSTTGNSLLEKEDKVGTNNANKKPAIALIGSNNKRFVITWQSEDQDDSAYGVFAQMYNATIICHCSGGSYSNYFHSNSCIPCEKGKYQNETGQSSCLACETGTYQNEEMQTTCKKCENGTYQNERGLSYCSSCISGKYQNLQMQTTCLDCGKGTYQNVKGQSQCKKCAVGTFQKLTGQTSCSPCLTGSYQDKEGQYNCLPCPAGRYQNTAGKTTCNTCKEGTYQDLEGQVNCFDCPAGTYNTKEGSKFIEDCNYCQTGTYQDLEGQGNCSLCPAGTYNTKEGSKFIEDCSPCIVGTYQDLEGQGNCSLCPMGKYQNGQGQTICEKCAPGSYSNREGQTICQQCEAGTYQEYENQILCQKCGFNTWQSSIGETQCNYCPINSETLSIKTTLIKECFCSIGYYGDSGNTCNKCPDNGICNEFNQPYPLPKLGYWSSKDDPLNLIKCSIEQACPGNAINLCNTSLGYTGYKCTECMYNFYKLDFKCETCPQNANLRLISILLIILLIIIILLYIAKQATAYFGSFTIIFSFLQLLSILYQLNVDWPTTLNQTFKLCLPFEFNLDFLATECSFTFSYLEKWTFIQLSPFIFAIIFILIYILISIHSKLIVKFDSKTLFLKKCPRLMNKPSKSVDNKLIYYFKLIRYTIFSPFFNGFSKQELRDLKNIFINVYLTLLTLLYLILSQKCFEFFDCEYDANENKYSFNLDTAKYCFESWWWQAFPFLLIFIILYIVGIPLLIVYLLMKNSKILTEKQFDLKFGLLCSRYNKSFFFWEIIIMLRKLFLVIFKIFLFNYPDLQIILFLLLLLIVLILQFKFRPYIEKRHNFLESFLVAVPIIILFSGLIFNSGEVLKRYTLRNQLTAFIILLIAFSCLMFLSTTLLDIKNRMKNNKMETKKRYNTFEYNNIITLLQKKKLSILLLLNWYTTLNSSHLKKINIIFANIFNQNGNGKGKPRNDDDSKADKNKQLLDLINNIYQNDLINNFGKWYNNKANNAKKIRMHFLIENYIHYKNSSDSSDQK